MTQAPAGRVLRLPSAGPLLLSTDLHGNLDDFRRMRELFLELRSVHGRCQLLFSGDLIHGPCYAREEWPNYLGTFYLDRSAALLDELMALGADYPDEVHCLLGNHEHSHIGGPHTPKFWEDETAYFEHSVGPEAARRYREFFRSFALVALADCGIVFTHAAPNVQLSHLEELERVDYAGHEQMNLTSIYAMPLLGRLLWSRRCPATVAQQFLAVLGENGTVPRLVVFGHDIAMGGFERFGDEQLMLSTSFGLDDEDKTYLEIDLGAHYESAAELVPGRELRPLYPR